MTELEDLKIDIEQVKNQYIKQLEELKAKIEELEQETQEDETDNRWKPKLGQEYWWVDTNGDIYSDRCTDTVFEKDIFKCSGVFPNVVQAEYERECRRIRRTLMKYGKNFDPGNDNWAFNYNYRDKIFGYWNSKYSCHPFAIYFESEEMAKKAVEEVGENRIKKYLFRIGGIMI